jgi:valyl-tRNA synthetase
MLAHPVMPFVTEELWQYVRSDGEGLLAGLVREPADEGAIDEQAERTLEWVIEATQALRRWRDEFDVPQGKVLRARLEHPVYAGDDGGLLLARAARLDLQGAGAGTVAIGVPGGSVTILEDIDLGARDARRERELAKLDAEIARSRAKLGNEQFLANAPPHVVAAEREKLAELERRRVPL